MTTTAEPVQKPTRLGDVNTDGDITLEDAVLLCRTIAGDDRVSLSVAGRANADIDGSGKVDNLDLTLLLKRISGQNTGF